MSSGAVQGVVASTGAADDSEGAGVDVDAGEETTVASGEKPTHPTKLQALMLQQKEKMDALRERVAQLRERLKRTPPEELQKARQASLDRFLALKTERENQRESIKNRLQDLKDRPRGN